MRWVNAIAEVIIPLDIDVNATDHEKLDMAVRAFDKLIVPDDCTCVIKWEDFEDE